MNNLGFLRELMILADRETFANGNVSFWTNDWVKDFQDTSAFSELRLFVWACSICSDFTPVVDSGGFEICFDCLGMLGDWYREEIGYESWANSRSQSDD